MVRNVGHSIDKLLRIVIGIGLLSLLAFARGNLRWPGLIGLVPILTVVFGWCPDWVLLGINAVKKEQAASAKNLAAADRAESVGGSCLKSNPVRRRWKSVH